MCAAYGVGTTWHTVVVPHVHPAMCPLTQLSPTRHDSMTQPTLGSAAADCQSDAASALMSACTFAGMRVCERVCEKECAPV